MSDLQTVIKEAKSALEKGYVFIHVKDHWLQTLLNGLEELQREIGRNKQIRYNATEAHINVQSKLQTEIERLRAENAAIKKALQKIGAVIVNDADRPIFYDCVRLANDTLFTLTKEESV